MFAVDRIILIVAILILVGIASSKFSARLGLPVLVLFLGVGMLAGSEGVGGIEFENYRLAHGIGSVALAIILFDGGLRTTLEAFRKVLAPSVLLATVGVFITAGITGLAASWITGVPLLLGLLLGSIVGSTDAAAVFAVLRSKGLNLRERLSALLEVESASNDPMAIFLTVGLLQVLLGEIELGPSLIKLFVMQMSVGAIVGVAIGFAAVWAINRVNLDAAGLYPVLVTAAGLLSYGIAANLGGSGFLAVYLAGIVIGNSRVVFKTGILRFHDGAAWLSQIAMFVLLGLLAFPSRLLAVAHEGLLVAAALIFVARPVAVGVILPWFRFSFNEFLLVSWVGLKGAVPVVLATFPLLLGLEGGETIFDMVFFVVLVSAVLQGWTLPPAARLLGLQVPPKPEAPVSLEITSLKDVEGDIVEYTVTADSLAVGQPIRDLALPEEAVVAMVVRGQRIIPPRGSTRLEAGDHVFLVLQQRVRPLVDLVFARGAPAPGAFPTHVEFPLTGDTTVGDLKNFYGIEVEAESDELTLDQLLRERLGDGLVTGAEIMIGDVSLRVRGIENGRVEHVGLAIRPPEEVPDDAPVATTGKAKKS
ncbi:MAG: potassium/proton antiporter [Gemmatimonadota bacterium]